MEQMKLLVAFIVLFILGFIILIAVCVTGHCESDSKK